MQAGFHSSMPRSNPHARERVMDDGKHLDALASLVPFAGREASIVSSAGSSPGGALQTPSRAIGDQEVLETASSRGSPPSRRTPRLGALGPCRRWNPLARTGETVTRTARSLGLVGAPQGGSRNENRSDGKQPVVLPGGESHRCPRRFVAAGQTVRLHGLPEKRGTGLSYGSCSRSYRRGRNRTNGVVVVDARSTGRPRRRAEAKRSGGKPSRRE